MTLTLHRVPAPPGWHAYDADYLELFALPVIGPSASWMLRRLHTLAPAAPGDTPTTVEPDLLAELLGLSVHRGTFDKTLQRLAIFHLVDRPDDHNVGIPERMRWLTQRQIERLPGVLQEVHRVEMERYRDARAER